jgi:hypothetical protein
MINDVIVLDDVLPEQYQNKIRDELLSEYINWHFMKDIAFNQKDIKDFQLSKSIPAFAHKFYDRSVGVISPGYGLVLPVVYFACEKIDYKINEIINVRSFLSMPVQGSTHDHVHVDRPEPHTVVLYYVDDSDGDTIFFNETYKDISEDNAKFEKLTIRKTVTPKKGRAVIFDGSFYHTATRPTNGSRLIINFGLW